MSEMQIVSPIQLLETTLLKLTFDADENGTGKQLGDGNFSLKTEYMNKSEEGVGETCSCRIDINFTMLDKDSPNETILELGCRYEATVGIPVALIAKEVSKEDLEEALQKTAFALGYASMKSAVEGIVRQTKFDGFFLPTIDVEEYMIHVRSEATESA